MWPISRRQLLAGGAVGVAGGFALFESPVAESQGQFLALGDSYTVGTAVADGERWVNGLVADLQDEGVDVTPPDVVARNGWTTDHLGAAIEERSLAPEYDLVTLLVGVNDAFQGRPLERFRPKFVDLLNRSVEFADDGASVVVMTIPDYTYTPVGQQYSPEEHRARLERYNDAICEAVAATDARLVDLIPPSRTVEDRPELVADDGLHPSPAQHDRWLERVLSEARAALA